MTDYVYIELGIPPNEPPVLFKLTIWQDDRDISDDVCLFRVQIGKFVLAVYVTPGA